MITTCPLCNTELEIGSKEIETINFSANVYYAACSAIIDEDPNFGGGYACEFFIVRESEEALQKELERLNNKGAIDEQGTNKESDILGRDA